MPRLQTVSVVDALAATLRAGVLDGVPAAGAPLAETDVAARYGVSRPTAKAALAALAHEGLLRRTANRPAHVPRLTAADVRDVYRVRIPLELEVVRHVAERRPLAGAALAVARLRDLPADPPASAFVTADLAFHRSLVEAVASPRLERVYGLLLGEIHLSMVQAERAVGRERITDDHTGILESLQAGDAAEAGRRMRTHLEHSRDALAELLDAQSELVA